VWSFCPWVLFAGVHSWVRHAYSHLSWHAGRVQMHAMVGRAAWGTVLTVDWWLAGYMVQTSVRHMTHGTVESAQLTMPAGSSLV
jgi:hypothetical protein